MRVAYVLTQDRGGPADVAVTLAHTLAAGPDVEVRLFGPEPARDPGRVRDLLEPVSVDTKLSLAAMRQARAGLLRWRPDIVHAQDRRSGLLCARLGLSHRRPDRPRVVHTYHGVPDDVSERWFAHRGGPRPSSYTLATLAADAIVARQVACTVVPSASMGTFLTDRLRVPADRLEHIDNGLVLPEANPPQRVRRLLSVGLLVERKGYADLLDALAMGRRERLPGLDDLELLVAGDGPLRSELEARAARLGLAGRVSFLGYRHDVPALLSATDAVVLPSRMEQQPLAIIEAMGAAKLVVATAVGGVPEMLAEAGPGALVVPPGDVRALAQALSGLTRVADPAVAGRALAALARRRFSADATAAAHLALYRRLLPPRDR